MTDIEAIRVLTFASTTAADKYIHIGILVYILSILERVKVFVFTTHYFFLLYFVN